MVGVAIVQMKSSVSKDENLKFSLEQIREARKKKAKMICFPEFQMAFSPNSQSTKELFSVSELVDGGFITELRKSAKENDIHVIGTIYERSTTDSDELAKPSNKNEGSDNQYCVYDTAVFIDN